MDISKIGAEALEELGINYSLLIKDIYGDDFEGLADEKKRKIRNKLIKNNLDSDRLGEELLTEIKENMTDSEFFELLKNCCERYEINREEKKQSLLKVAEGLPENTGEAIWELFDFGISYECRADGKNLILSSTHGACYTTNLVLTDSTYLPEKAPDCLLFDKGSFIKNEKGYRIVCESENFKEDTTSPVVISFSYAELKTVIHKPEFTLDALTPWEMVSEYIYGIHEKCELEGDYLNDREKTLLPLISDLHTLLYPYLSDGKPNLDFIFFRAYAEKHDANGILPYLKKYDILKNINFSDKSSAYIKLNDLSNGLKKRLNHQKYEPLWRDIFRLLSKSQEEYPTSAELFCPDKLEEKKQELERLLKEKGFNGSYPHFTKSSEFKGIRLAESYNTSYFIGNEKNVSQHIYCTDYASFGEVNICLYCGTLLLSENQEDSSDFYSCTFNTGGKSFATPVILNEYYEIKENQTVSYSTEEVINIAIKKTELKRLNKRERDGYPYKIPLLDLFLPSFILLGGIFSIALTFSLRLLSIIITAAFGFKALIPDMLNSIPWDSLLLIAWAGFGGLTGIISVIVKRK